MCEQPHHPHIDAGLSRREALAAGGMGVLAAAVLRGRGSPDRVLPQDGGVEVAPGLSIQPRDTWATDRPPKPGLVPEDVKFLLVHHTAGTNSESVAHVPKTLREVYDYHTGPAKGWPDVCYNFFVDPFGTVWEGRSGSLAGPVAADATGGSQGFAQLVCLLGDFTSVMPTDAALDALTSTLAWMAQRFQIDVGPDSRVQFTSRGSNRWPAGVTVDAKTVSGHRDMSSTACPGDDFYPYVHDTLPEAVKARLASFGMATPDTAGPAPTAVSTTSVPSTLPLNVPLTVPTSATVAPSSQASDTTMPSPIAVDTTSGPASSSATSSASTATSAPSSVAPSSIESTTTSLDGTGAAGKSSRSSSEIHVVAIAAGVVGVLAAAGGAYAVGHRGGAEDDET